MFVDEARLHGADAFSLKKSRQIAGVTSRLQEQRAQLEFSRKAKAYVVAAIRSC